LQRKRTLRVTIVMSNRNRRTTTTTIMMRRCWFLPLSPVGVYIATAAAAVSQQAMTKK